MKKYMLCFLILSSCSHPIEITPNKLPDAYINQPYYSEININGGKVADISFIYKVHSNDLTIEPAGEGPSEFNKLVIKGTPTKLKPINVYIEGETYGTNFTGKHFKKSYIIKVRSKEVSE